MSKSQNSESFLFVDHFTQTSCTIFSKSSVSITITYILSVANENTAMATGRVRIVLAGFVADKGLSSAFAKDFYLQSYGGLLGGMSFPKMNSG